LRQNNPWVELIADQVFVFNENLVYATFDLTGTMDIVEYGFRVISEGNSELQISAFAPGIFWRVARSPSKIVITFINTGDVDIENAIVVVDSPAGNLIAPTLELLRANEGVPVLEVMLQEPNGPPGIIRPGASGTIEVFVWSTPLPSFVVGLK
jgi:hypothetical protein